MDSLFQNQPVEEIFSTTVTLVATTALDEQKRRALYLKSLRHTLFPSFQIPFHLLYLLVCRTKAYFPVTKHLVRIEYMAVLLRSHHVARKSHCVLRIPLREMVLSRVRLTLRTTGAVRWLVQNQVHFSVRTEMVSSSHSSSKSLNEVSRI